MGENALTQPASLGTEVPAGPPRSPWTLPANTSLWKGFAVFQLIHWPTTCCKTDALIITAATFHGLLETFRHESGSEMRAWLRNLHNVQSFRPEKNRLGLQRNHTEIKTVNVMLIWKPMYKNGLSSVGAIWHYCLLCDCAYSIHIYFEWKNQLSGQQVQCQSILHGASTG